MKGSRVFTETEADRIRRLLAERQSTDSPRPPKDVRTELRALGMHIEDWGQIGMTTADFDALVAEDRVRIVEDW